MSKILTLFALSISFSLISCAHNQSINREQIRFAIRSHIKLFTQCYDLALKKDKNIQGKIIVQWDIVDGGAVKNVSVIESSLSSKAENNSILEKCVTDTVANITFPQPPKDQLAQVKYPFVFKTNEPVQIIEEK